MKVRETVAAERAGGGGFRLSSTEVDVGAKVHSQQYPTQVLPPPQVLEEAGLAWREGRAPDAHGT